jgi:hypothetical protein
LIANYRANSSDSNFNSGHAGFCWEAFLLFCSIFLNNSIYSSTTSVWCFFISFYIAKL